MIKSTRKSQKIHDLHFQLETLKAELVQFLFWDQIESNWH